MSRKLDDWLKRWLEYSSGLESPERMRLWAGLSAISAALQRKCWAKVRRQHLYPNLYVLLVGPPGVGKGNAMKRLTPWLREIEELKIAPDGLTRRSFFSALEAAEVGPLDFSDGQSAVDFADESHHSLSAFVEELGVFLHPGDSDFVYALCHAYDAPPYFHYKTEHAGENFVQNAYFSMISACTPKSLREIFTEWVMELGISARTIIVFSDERIEVPIFDDPPEMEQLEKDLKYDLKRISRIHGCYTFSNECAEQLVEWSKSRFSPAPRDPRFEHYNTRRFVQIVKLCICCAASKRQDPIILPSDLYQAKTFLLEAERHMSSAIQSIGANPYLQQQQVAIKYINTKWTVQSAGTVEGELRQRLSADLDPRYSDMVLEELTKAKWVSCVGKAPHRIFYPRGKAPEAKIVDEPKGG